VQKVDALNHVPTATDKGESACVNKLAPSSKMWCENAQPAKVLVKHRLFLARLAMERGNP
jgi:hypothetical protein